MMGIYSAGEPADSDVTGAKLAEAIESAGRSVHFLADETALESKLEELTEGDDVILMIGAGSITQYAHSLVKAKSTDGKVI
jgi:UDP-N-acetylmuramate-alanine ligase